MSGESLAHLGVDSQVSNAYFGLNPSPGACRRPTDSRWWPGPLVRERCALYTRTVAGIGDAEKQLQELRRYVLGRGWEVDREYSDTAGRSGAEGLSALMRDAQRQRFDLIVVTRFSRFARSVGQLSRALAELDQLGIDFVSCQDGVETAGASGGALRELLSAVARMEQDLKRERSAEGGARSGRPGARLDYQRLVRLRSQGLSHRAIARLFGVSHATVGRRLRRGW